MQCCPASRRAIPSVFAVLVVAGLLLQSDAEGANCGGKNQRPCTIFERIPSCDSGLVQDFLKGLCVARDVPGRDCGRVNQRPCKIWERIPSCNTGLVEDFLKGQCVTNEDAERQRIANAKLRAIGSFVAAKTGFATSVAGNPRVRSALRSSDKTAVARVVNPSRVGQTQMPDGYLLRTLTIGATTGGKVLLVGTAGGVGASIDLKGTRPAYAYAGGGYSFGPGLAAGAGIEVGFWVCQNNKIGGDAWGVEFGVDDLAKAYIGAVSLTKGPSLAIALWFDYSNGFQGFTITPGFGVGADFGGVIRSSTAVHDDPSVGCDGRPIPKAAPLGPKSHIQTITYDGGVIRQQKVTGKAPRPDLVRICLENHTGQPKEISYVVAGINTLKAATNGSRSCANFSSRLRLNFAFVDRGAIRKRDVMTLQSYAGDIVVFEWLRDY